MSSSALPLERRGTIDTLAAVLMVWLTFSWGLNQVAIKVSDTGYSPVFLSVARSAIGAVLVFGWCFWRRIPLLERDGTLPAGIAAGVLFGLEFVLIFFGLDHTSAARGTLMLNAMPFWVLIGGHLFLDEKMSRARFVGALMAFAGVALVFSDKLSLPGPSALLGDMMCLVAGIFWGGSTLIIKRSRLATASAEKTLLYQLVVSTLITLPLLPLGGPLLRQVSPLATAALLFQAVYVVAVTYIVWFWLIRRYPASGLSSFAFLSPAFSVLLAGLLLNEPLSARIFLALGLIAVGLVVINRPARAASRTG